MSKYKIYRVDHYDPILIGKRRRRMNGLFAVGAITVAPLFILFHQIFNIGIGETNLILMITLGGFYYLFYRKLRSENNNFKTIGDIEFTKAGVIKHISDSTFEFNYDSINTIELQRHIPALTIAESKSGFYTYILTLSFKDSHTESLVVSDQPLGKRSDLSITETIKTLKKITSANVILK